MDIPLRMRPSMIVRCEQRPSGPGRSVSVNENGFDGIRIASSVLGRLAEATQNSLTVQSLKPTATEDTDGDANQAQDR